VKSQNSRRPNNRKIQFFENNFSFEEIADILVRCGQFAIKFCVFYNIFSDEKRKFRSTYFEIGFFQEKYCFYRFPRQISINKNCRIYLFVLNFARVNIKIIFFWKNILLRARFYKKIDQLKFVLMKFLVEIEEGSSDSESDYSSINEPIIHRPPQALPRKSNVTFEQNTEMCRPSREYDVTKLANQTKNYQKSKMILPTSGTENVQILSYKKFESENRHSNDSWQSVQSLVKTVLSESEGSG
jgi:hypothetical protein